MFQCSNEECPNFGEIFIWEDDAIDVAECGGCHTQLERQLNSNG